MVVQDDMVTLSKKETEDLIERECKKRLGISIQEFQKKRERGELVQSIAVHDVELLLKLAESD